MPVMPRRAESIDALAVARIHWEARAAAMPWLNVAHTEEETFWWIEHILIPNQEVWAAEAGGRMLGFVALLDDWVEHLYVDPTAQGQGIGRQLLDLAKQRSPHCLQLHVFARNEQARCFYEAAGFALIAESDGSGNEEGEPDCTYAWRS